MKKNLLILLSLCLTVLVVHGQQMTNPSFEDWEDAGTVIDEPVNWSSIKTSDAGSLINNAAPVVWGQINASRPTINMVACIDAFIIDIFIMFKLVATGRLSLVSG